MAPSLSCPLIGVHTAGVGTIEGYGEILLRESFEDFVKNEVEYTVPQMDEAAGAYRLNGQYEPVGKLDGDMQPSFSQDTRIRPSVIHGVFPVNTEPAPLHSKDDRLDPPCDIFRIGVSKRCAPLGEFDKRDLEVVRKDMEEMLIANVTPVRSKVEPLTITEAIEGFEIKGYEPMEMSTSEGFPWTICRPKGASNKSWLFQYDYSNGGRLKIKGIQKDLYETLLYKDAQRRSGIVPSTYFTACLKDARILRSKVSTPGKTRIFEMSPVDLTIAQRQYFGDFYAAYRASWNAEHTIGINPDGEQWSRLARELIQFSAYILTADFSGYGPSLSHTILENVFSNQSAWLRHYENTDDNDTVRESIKHEVVHGYHVARNLVFVPTSGLPSGNAATVENNSLGNSQICRVP
nr:MAG: RNA-dependent RNA polymerase [Riboviria sp.]